MTVYAASKSFANRLMNGKFVANQPFNCKIPSNLLGCPIWTPPQLQAFRFMTVRHDCSRISGL